jgi:hypothetical protein
LPVARCCREAGDSRDRSSSSGSAQAATHKLQAAGRIGGRYRPYYAALTAADIVLDRNDHAAAREILASLDERATTGTTTHTAATASRHQRLAELGARPRRRAPINGARP